VGLLEGFGTWNWEGLIGLKPSDLLHFGIRERLIGRFGGCEMVG
jgi:hypothetical protein